MIPQQRTRNTRGPGTPGPGRNSSHTVNLFGMLDERPRFDLYGRSEAIADRVLIEVPHHLARAFGLSRPTAITAQVWADVIAWPDKASMTPAPWPFECESARLAEVLHRLPADTGTFEVFRINPATPLARPVRVRLALTVHTGDMGETVATIAHAATDPDAG